jgi:WD40 repeat protein
MEGIREIAASSRVLYGHRQSVTCLAIWNDFLCSGSNDRTVKLWNEKGECVVALQGHTYSVSCLTVWNGFICSGSFDNTIRIWNANMQAGT